MQIDLNWIVSNHGEFLEKFGFTYDKIIAEHKVWTVNHPEYLATDYFLCELFRQAILFNIKNAKTEEEFINNNIEIISKMLAIQTVLSQENRYSLEQQLHLDRLMLSNLTLPFKFDVQIKTNNCCSYCNKKNNKVYPLAKILEKNFLPFSKCKNEDKCKCTYSVVPLVDEKGNLLPKDLS